MIKYKSKLVPKGFIGITIWPHTYIRYDKEYIIKSRGLNYLEKLINHEKIHLKQWVEFGIILFPIFYAIGWLIAGFSYRNNFLEKEAYDNEYDINYLKHRKLFSSIKYLKNKV